MGPSFVAYHVSSLNQRYQSLNLRSLDPVDCSALDEQDFDTGSIESRRRILANLQA